MNLNKEQADAILAVPAIAVNNVNWNFTPFGMRITFSEIPIVEGQNPHFRLAVMIPLPIAKSMIDGMVKSFEEANTAVANDRAKAN